MHTDSENPMKCNIIIGVNEAMGLSTLDMPRVINVFQDPKEGIIYFYIYGDCIIEFDDMETEDLLKIFNELKEKNNINVKIID